MNPPKCNEFSYINFLVATPRVFSCPDGYRATRVIAAVHRSIETGLPVGL